MTLSSLSSLSISVISRAWLTADYACSRILRRMIRESPCFRFFIKGKKSDDDQYIFKYLCSRNRNLVPPVANKEWATIRIAFSDSIVEWTNTMNWPRRELEPPSVLPPSKKQKLSLSLFVVRQRDAKGEELRDIIDIGNVEWVTFNGDKYDYIYYVLGLILEVNTKELTIYRCDDGKSRDDSSSKWRHISPRDPILGGYHLVAWKGGITMPLRDTDFGNY